MYWTAKKTRYHRHGFATKMGTGSFVFAVHLGPSDHPTIGMPYMGLTRGNDEQHAIDQSKNFYLAGFDGKDYT